MPIEQVAIGKDLYVFTSKSGINLDAWGANPNCIIDSHGYRPPTKPYFTVKPGMRIHFYVNRHAFLMAGERPGGGFRPGTGYHVVDSVEDIANGAVQPVETIEAGQRCPDYELSKQLKHNDGTEDDGRYSRVGYEDLKRYLMQNRDVANRFDLLSIRNRAFRTVMLSDILKKLSSSGYAYTDVHCSFCRGGFLDGVKDMLFKNGRNELPGGQRYRR